jgi:drug/metabolite transporter (DMT)-like permease
MRLVAVFCFLLNTILWATYYSVSKEALHRIDPIVFSFLEVSVLAPIAILIIVLRRKNLSKDTIKRGVILGAVLCLNVFTTTTALKYTTATNTAFFPAMNGFLAALLAWAFFRQSVRGVTWFAGVLSIVGALLLVFESPVNGQWVGDLIAFAGAFFYTCYIFRVDYDTRQASIDAWLLLGVELISLIVFSLIGSSSVGNWDLSQLVGGKDLAIIIYVGIATTFLPAAIALFMQRHVSPVTVAFIYILEPIWGALVAVIYLGERLSGIGWLGGALIIAAAVVNTWRSSRDQGYAEAGVAEAADYPPGQAGPAGHAVKVLNASSGQ